MKKKFKITKFGYGKKITLPNESIVLDDKTTQTKLKKVFNMGMSNLVIEDDAEESENDAD